MSLRRDETPTIGEVYKHNGRYLLCVEDKGQYGCYRCAFCETSCRKPCDEGQTLPLRHFETVIVDTNGDFAIEPRKH